MISRRLRHLLAIADEGSFTRAAGRLGIGQAPLSQSIQRLEQSLGVALLQRTARGAKLTPAGEAFVVEARRSVAAAERAVAAARSAVTRDRPLRVGVILPAILSPLKRLVHAARSVGVSLDLIDGANTELHDLLLHGELDLSFLTPPFDDVPALSLISVGKEALVAALPDSMARLPGEYAPMAEMAERLILPPRSYGEALHDAMIGMFTIAGHRPVVAAEITRVFTMLSLISADVGAGIVAPSMGKALNLEGITLRPFAPEIASPVWEVALAHFPAQAGSTLDILVRAARESFCAS